MPITLWSALQRPAAMSVGLQQLTPIQRQKAGGPDRSGAGTMLSHGVLLTTSQVVRARVQGLLSLNVSR
jgi:hypothetical protein